MPPRNDRFGAQQCARDYARFGEANATPEEAGVARCSA
jgi:hypothetical protein